MQLNRNSPSKLATVAHSCSLHLLFPREMTVDPSMPGLLKGLGYRERPSLKEGRCSFLYIRLLIKDYLKYAGNREKLNKCVQEHFANSGATNSLPYRKYCKPLEGASSRTPSPRFQGNCSLENGVCAYVLMCHLAFDVRATQCLCKSRPCACSHMSEWLGRGEL